jgi:hypothetical protein
MTEKQTALDYFIQQLEEIGFSTHDFCEFNAQVLAAKEIEKEQIKQAYQKGVISLSNRTADEYYEQTFNK